MGRLIYHDTEEVSGQFSRFDEAVLEVAASGSVGIVSPYIGVDYLQRIIQVTTEWQLISDIEAWLSSLSIRARPKAWVFIRDNLERIHHCPAIHAKAVISQKLAMFGSANLTNAGILARTEMGILIDDQKMVMELRTWFDTLWQQTCCPVVSETNAFVQWLDEESSRMSVRRARFPLSTTSKRIRARLVKLRTPLEAEPDGALLNLDFIAQEMVCQEQRHYDTLEEAIDAAIDHLARETFSFGQIVANTQQIFPMATVREVFFALLQHCANHVLTVFAENTRNRLILSNGKFTQSTSVLISKALAPFDYFLAYLVHHFNFSQSFDMPYESNIEKDCGIRPAHQLVLISSLLDCGFLELQDIAGQLPRYKLSEDFEWVGRYKLFSRSMLSWNTKKNQPRRRAEILIPSSTESDRDYLENKLTLARFPDKSSKEKDVALRRTRNVTNRLSISSVHTPNTEHIRLQRERKEKIDKVLSNVINRLISGERLVTTKELANQISNETSVGAKLVWLIISGKGEEIPMVITKRSTGISICPGLDWKVLMEYPLTERACRTYLKG